MKKFLKFTLAILQVVGCATSLAVNVTACSHHQCRQFRFPAPSKRTRPHCQGLTSTIPICSLTI